MAQDDGDAAPSGEQPRTALVRSGNFNNEDRDPARYRRASEFEDSQVRAFLLRASYSVTSEHDTVRFTDIMRFVEDRHDARVRNRMRRTKILIWLAGTVGASVIATGIGLASRWLKLPLQ